MYNHWDIFIKSALDGIELRHIVEIGADNGKNTKNLLEYCRQKGSRLTTIDCEPSSEVLAFTNTHKDIFTLSDKTSLEALPELPEYEAILIDGDHNWYTVYHELKIIENTFAETGKFPLIFLHDIAWPFARRDMYYSPERIPGRFRHNYSKKGILPGQPVPIETLGHNAGFCNALHEGGAKNGVLTAVEDFIKESKRTLRFAIFNGYFGLGLLTSQKTIESFPKLVELFNYMDRSASIGDAMQNMMFETICLNYDIYNSRTYKTGKVFQKVFRFFIPRKNV